MILEQNGECWWLVDAEGPHLSALDLIGEAGASDLIVVPTSRLDPHFFQLKTGVAGEFLQKMANYRYRVAFVGDIEPWLEASEALQALVRECNRGQAVAFVPDMNALMDHMTKK
jgi:hypothetical protein